MHERCNELSSQLDTANRKIDALTAELKEENKRNRDAINRVLSVVQRANPEAMDQVRKFDLLSRKSRKGNDIVIECGMQTGSRRG